MTATDGQQSVLIWDASALHHAAKAERLDVLGDLARGPDSRPWTSVTTAAVVEELYDHGLSLTGEAWLNVVHVDGLDEIVALTRWFNVVSSTAHSRGEATVLAWAEVHRAIAIIDDQDARQAARRQGLCVHGSLWVVAQAICEGRISEVTARGFVDSLTESGARYPFGRGEYVDWARGKGLLP